MRPSRNARATFWPRFLSWTYWIPQSPCRPPSQRPAPSLHPRPPSRAHKTCHDSNSRLAGRLLVTAVAGDARAEPESNSSSECASAGAQTTALCHPVSTLWPAGLAPTPPKQISEPPPTAPQTPPGCTHSGGAPALTAHMSLLYGYHSPHTQSVCNCPLSTSGRIEPTTLSCDPAPRTADAGHPR